MPGSSGARGAAALDAGVRGFVADSYPHNHDYDVVAQKDPPLRPRWKLKRRWKRLRELYPPALGSLLDVGCAKGFFVLEAAGRPGCERALGIDVHAPFLDAARAVGRHLALPGARFAELRLHELAESLGDHGGPFQTVLLVNAYHYLFCGSGFDGRRYGSHAEIFAHLRRVTGERLLFSNRLSMDACPRNVQERARELGINGEYTETAIRAAAAAHFRIEEHGKLGRIPLWRLTPR